jgi:hypothetical protein
MSNRAASLASTLALPLALLLAGCVPASSGDGTTPPESGGSGGNLGSSATGGRSASGGDSGGTGGSPGSGGASSASGGTKGSDPDRGGSGTGGAGESGQGGATAGATGGTTGSSGDAGPADAPTSGPPLGNELPPCGRTVQVADAAALTPAITGAMAGDCIVLADGTYPGFTITAKGTLTAPIVVRAANKLKAVMMGNVLMMGAEYVVAEGFTYPGMSSAIAQSSLGCRITRSRFNSGVARANGTSKQTRIDHNEFGPKSSGDGHYIHATESSEFSQIDHNYLHDATGGGMSRDAVSLGCCGPEFDYHETGNVFEYNLLVNCSSDAEYISIKSSSNKVRYNTFRRNGGTLTLRAGRKNEIYGNFFFGGGGIRAYEDDHKIWNNYIETGTALAANGNGGGHAPLRRAIIVHNTFLGGVTITGAGHTIANNIGGGGGMGNLSMAAAGLVRKGEILAAAATSGTVDKGVGTFPFLTDDLQGQPRDKADIGADEWSTAPEVPLRRPLMPADVGPDAP